MLKPWTTLHFPFFDKKIVSMLRMHALAHIDSMTLSTHQYTDFDHLRFCTVPDQDLRLHDLISKCSVAASPHIFMLPPNVVMPIHRDTENTSFRLSTIAVPLHPIIGYAPTHWFLSKTSEYPSFTAYWDDMSPKLLDIDMYHGNIITNDHWRCTFQISLAADYAEVHDLILGNKLFNGYDCTIGAHH